MVATCFLLGVSTRRMDRLVQSLGITGLSKSQVPVMARDLDELVRDFRERPLDAGPYTFVAADALTVKVRERRPGHQDRGHDRHRRQRRRLPRDPRRGHLHRRVRSRMEHQLRRTSSRVT